MYIYILYSAHLRETISFSYCISGSHMIYELGVYEERNTFFCCWDMLLGYSRKNLNRGGGSVIKKVEFPGVIKKKSCEISRGISFLLTHKLRFQMGS